MSRYFDCERIFGYFLHHFPYYGMRGEKDFEAFAIAGGRMQELYEQTFGERQVAGVQIAPSNRAANTQAADYVTSAAPAYCTRAVESAYCIKLSAASEPQMTAPNLERPRLGTAGV